MCQALSTMLSGGHYYPHCMDEEIEAKWLVSCRANTGSQGCVTPCALCKASESLWSWHHFLQPSSSVPQRPCPGAEPSQKGSPGQHLKTEISLTQDPSTQHRLPGPYCTAAVGVVVSSTGTEPDRPEFESWLHPHSLS